MIQRHMRYEVRVEGAISESWASSLGELQVAVEDEQTVLIAAVADEAELHGLLTQLYDLGLRLLSLRRLDLGPHRGAQP